jgi:NADH-quinone oxidoreductase subunit L
LKSHLPITYKTFLVGAIAIAGIPPLSGFVSKDEILWKAFAGGYWPLWLLGLLGAGLTAFYMFRLVSLTFEGKPRWEHGAHPHEAPLTMTIPLIVLAVLSVAGGAIGWPASLGGGNAIEHWLDPIFERAALKLPMGAHGVEPVEFVLMVLSVGVALTGIMLARRWYLRKPGVPDALAARFPRLYGTLLKKYSVDELYDAAVVRPAYTGSEKLLWKGVDVGMIDWLVNALPKAVGMLSGAARRMQTGVTQSYAVIFLLGVVTILAWLLMH